MIGIAETLNSYVERTGKYFSLDGMGWDGMGWDKPSLLLFVVLRAHTYARTVRG